MDGTDIQKSLNLIDNQYLLGKEVNDEKFTPKGANAWTPDKYKRKLKNLASVISKLSREHVPAGPAILGVAEVENRKVLKDLVKTDEIATTGYKIVHYDSPDRRGIDVALLYNPNLFTLTSSKTHSYVLPDSPVF